MAFQRTDRAEVDTYSAEQVEQILRSINVRIEGETFSHFISYCPYHNNTDTPCFETDKKSGLSFCFNPACNVGPTLPDMIVKIGKMTHFQAARLIQKLEIPSGDFAKSIESAMEVKPKYVEFSQSILDDRRDDFWNSQKAINYMYGRKFEDDTLKHFEIGYSEKKDLIMVPMHSPEGMPVGVIGRKPSKTDKVFKNSVGLPSKTAIWNFHRAKKEGNTLIICEASFDAMRIHQAGHPNVVACLMGHFSAEHKRLIERSFDKVIIMTDDDEPKFYPNCRKCANAGLNLCVGHKAGQLLGEKIADQLFNLRIYWANYGSTRFPPGTKDAGDMTDDQIRACIRGSLSNFEYNMMYN